MPPRVNLFTARKAFPVSSPFVGGGRRGGALFAPSRSGAAARRWYSEKKTDLGGDPEQPGRMKGPTEDALPHVSEEAAATDRIMSKEKSCDGVPSSPELEQGSPVSEILQRNQEAAKHAPKVVQDMMKKSPSGSRSFSTSSMRRSLDQFQHPGTQGQGQGQQPQPEAGKPADEVSAAMVANMIAQVDHGAAEKLTGLKFPMPEDLPKTENFRTRYEPLLDQFTKLLMEDGKLSRAQKNMNYILDQLRTSSPPQPNPKRPLLPGPPGPQLPLNPVLYLTLIVDSVAPLIKIRNQKGIAGGGAAVQIPVPLSERQRRRTAIKWIIDGSSKRRDSRFAARVAQELQAVAEGKGGVWDRREQVHKLGVAGRANLGKRIR